MRSIVPAKLPASMFYSLPDKILSDFLPESECSFNITSADRRIYFPSQSSCYGFTTKKQADIADTFLYKRVAH